jgi:hypothetical protein
MGFLMSEVYNLLKTQVQKMAKGCKMAYGARGLTLYDTIFIILNARY